jgi:hypothetical protein
MCGITDVPPTIGATAAADAAAPVPPTIDAAGAGDRPPDEPPAEQPTDQLMPGEKKPRVRRRTAGQIVRDKGLLTRERVMEEADTKLKYGVVVGVVRERGRCWEWECPVTQW